MSINLQSYGNSSQVGYSKDTYFWFNPQNGLSENHLTLTRVLDTCDFKYSKCKVVHAQDCDNSDQIMDFIKNCLRNNDLEKDKLPQVVFLVPDQNIAEELYQKNTQFRYIFVKE